MTIALDQALTAAEARADAGDLPGAIDALEALRPGRPPAEASRILTAIASFVARSGDLEGALPQLELSEALAAGAPLAHGLARLTRASVLAALGRYDSAVPMALEVARGPDDTPELAELRADARAEASAYINLVSPKNRATWRALLERT